MSEWHSVTEKPPLDKELCYPDYERSIRVLITDGKEIYTGYMHHWIEIEYTSPKWLISGPDGYEFKNVTHWMYLPELPR